MGKNGSTKFNYMFIALGIVLLLVGFLVFVNPKELTSEGALERYGMSSSLGKDIYIREECFDSIEHFVDLANLESNQNLLLYQKEGCKIVIEKMERNEENLLIYMQCFGVWDMERTLYYTPGNFDQPGKALGYLWVGEEMAPIFSITHGPVEREFYPVVGVVRDFEKIAGAEGEIQISELVQHQYTKEEKDINDSMGKENPDEGHPKSKHDVWTEKELFAKQLISESHKELDKQENQGRYEYLLYYLAGPNIQKELETPSENHPERTQGEEILNSLGFYIYTENGSDLLPRKGEFDILLHNPIILYDAYQDQWIVGGGGTWQTDSWREDISDEHKVQKEEALGWMDEIGVVLYDTFGENPVLVSSGAYVSDGQNEKCYYHNPSNLDSGEGAIFQYQDKWSWKEGERKALENTDYFGKNFSAIAVYDSGFATWSGKARVKYVHTWDRMHIQSVEWDFWKLGFTTKYDTDKYRIEAYSMGETEF